MLRARLAAFADALQQRAFNFDDCSVGNLVFAGSFLLRGRRFNDAVDDYAALVGLPVGLIDNVTDGTNAHLVALDVDGHVLGREADIVDANRQNRIREIFLLPAALDRRRLRRAGRRRAPTAAAAALAARSLAAADESAAGGSSGRPPT